MRIPNLSCGHRAERSGASQLRDLGAACTAAVLLLGGRTPASARQLDPKFWTTDAPVYATALAGRTLYIGGSFDRVGPVTGGGAALDATSGLVLPGSLQVHGSVFAVATDGV